MLARPLAEPRPTGRPAVVLGAGFIGTAVARAFAAAGRPTTLVGRRPFTPPPGVVGVCAATDDRQALGRIIGADTDVVFAAGSAVPAHDELDPGPSLDSIRLLAQVLGLLRDRPRSTLLHLSSGGAVYGQPECLPVGEDHPLRPISAYGAAKAAAEAYVDAAVRRHGIAATNLRCGNAYGPGQDPSRPQGLVAELLAAAAAGHHVEIWGDGTATRDYLHVDDIAGVALALTGRTDLPLALNVGSGVATSVLDLIDAVTAVTGRPLAVRHRAARPFDVDHVVLDTARLHALVEHRPIALGEGLAASWSDVLGASVA